MNELIGHQIDNYRTELLLGRGGMGAVFRVHDLNLDRDVALIKNLQSCLSEKSTFGT